MEPAAIRVSPMKNWRSQAIVMSNSDYPVLLDTLNFRKDMNRLSPLPPSTGVSTSSYASNAQENSQESIDLENFTQRLNTIKKNIETFSAHYENERREGLLSESAWRKFQSTAIQSYGAIENELDSLSAYLDGKSFSKSSFEKICIALHSFQSIELGKIGNSEYGKIKQERGVLSGKVCGILVSLARDNLIHMSLDYLSPIAHSLFLYLEESSSAPDLAKEYIKNIEEIVGFTIRRKVGENDTFKPRFPNDDDCKKLERMCAQMSDLASDVHGYTRLEWGDPKSLVTPEHFLKIIVGIFGKNMFRVDIPDTEAGKALKKSKEKFDANLNRYYSRMKGGPDRISKESKEKIALVQKQRKDLDLAFQIFDALFTDIRLYPHDDLRPIGENSMTQKIRGLFGSGTSSQGI